MRVHAPLIVTRFDRDKSGKIEYPEFKRIWIKLANAREELASRGIEVGKWSTPWGIVNKLERILDEEEELEAHAMLEAERYRKWQMELFQKRRMITAAKVVAEQELCSALDAAGQVYVFGSGSANQFVGDPVRPHEAFTDFTAVSDAWINRVQPDGPIITKGVPAALTFPRRPRDTSGRAPRGKEGNVMRYINTPKSEVGGLRTSHGGAIADLSESPFKGVVCSLATAVLWGRRVCQAAAGLNTAVARSDSGQACHLHNIELAKYWWCRCSKLLMACFFHPFNTLVFSSSGVCMGWPQ